MNFILGIIILQAGIASTEIVEETSESSFYTTIFISLIVAFFFVFFQASSFYETYKKRKRFSNFFNRIEDYATYIDLINGENITQLKQVGKTGSDLNSLLAEINHYVAKTKGTTDFAVIQNKVERKLNMRYDQSVAKLAFPTYIGLMGTFAGVFLGIWMFLYGFDGAGNISDDSIKNLLIGVLVSMSTSFIGLFLTTINNALAGESRKNIEEDKNAFYDFVQTELMPSLDVSMVLAITRLHETVDRFEPAFDGIINRFQTTFDKCTKAFGDSFEKNVAAVASAVYTMGNNMDKINENINLQQQLLSTLKSGEIIRGLDKYIEAADHFVFITKSLTAFEETRNMMFAAVQETIKLQNSYNEGLKIPREIAVRCNQILDRIKTFEENVNRVGGSLDNRQILGNDVIESIREQVNAIRKKDKIALKYFEIADGKLSDVFEEQTKVLNEINSRHKEAIAGQIAGFEDMLKEQTEEIKNLHKQFIEQMQMHLNVEEIHKDFSNLKTLNEILDQLKHVNSDSVKAEELHKILQKIQEEIAKIDVNKALASKLGGNLGVGSSNSAEVNRLKSENSRQQGDVDRMKRQINNLEEEKKITPINKPVVTPPSFPESKPVTAEEKLEEKPKKSSRWWPFR